MARFGNIWQGEIKQDLARYEKVRISKIWQDMTSKIWQLKGKTWQDLARYDKARLGKIWQDMIR